jgi:DNA-binding NarL/FixJ family response regulator
MPPSYTDVGAQAAVELKRLHPSLGVLLLSQHVETRHTVHLVEQGAFGYLLKDRVLDVEEFLSAAERVAKGGSALDPHVVGRMVRRSTDPELAELTEREREVLQLMAEGLANAGIAKRMHLSGRTIEAHVRHLLLKLDLFETEDSNRRVLAVLAHLAAHAG